MTVRDSLFRKTAIVSIVFFVVAMCAVVYFSLNKTIEISSVADSSNTSEFRNSAEEVKVPDVDTTLLHFGPTESNTEYMHIPLPPGVEPEDIVIENHYMDRELHVILPKPRTLFYATNEIGGNHSEVKDGHFVQGEKDLTLLFSVDGIYEYKSVFENNDLYITFLNPREVYDRIVVIDPAYGGADVGIERNDVKAKEVTLDVAMLLKTFLDEEGIKAYFTRMDDVNPSEISRVDLANETKTDIYVRIEVDAKSDETLYGVTTCYNDDFFIPGFGSVNLADALESEVATAIKSKASGLEEADPNAYALRHSTVPSAAVKVGCITNKQEAVLLGRQDYREKIALGIFNGILKAYELMEK